MQRTKPYAVTTGRIPLVVMHATDGLPAAFALMGTRAEDKVALRLAGGCKGMDDNDKAEMIGFFSGALQGYKGLIFSGGTRQVNSQGEVDPMITDIPGVIAAENEGCVALGTIPRTDLLTLQADSRLVLDEYGTVPNPAMHGILIVQNGADGKLDWDGDVDAYFKLMDNWRAYAGFSALGLISWNGGDVTRAEVERSIKLGWPTVLVKGTGRATDEMIAQYEADDGKLLAAHPHVFVVHKNDSADLAGILCEKGFLN